MPVATIMGRSKTGRFSSTTLFFYMGISSANYVAKSAAAGLVAGTRHLVRVSYDGSKTAAGVSIYVNGARIGSTNVIKDIQHGQWHLIDPSAWVLDRTDQAQVVRALVRCFGDPILWVT